MWVKDLMTHDSVMTDKESMLQVSTSQCLMYIKFKITNKRKSKEQKKKVPYYNYTFTPVPTKKKKSRIMGPTQLPVIPGQYFYSFSGP